MKLKLSRFETTAAYWRNDSGERQWFFWFGLPRILGFLANLHYMRGYGTAAWLSLYIGQVEFKFEIST